MPIPFLTSIYLYIYIHIYISVRKWNRLFNLLNLDELVYVLLQVNAHKKAMYPSNRFSAVDKIVSSIGLTNLGSATG